MSRALLPERRPDAAHFTQTISALGHLLELRIDQALSAQGITARQYSALLHISRDADLHRVSLARILNVSPQAAAGLTRRLRERGLIERIFIDPWSPITFAITDVGLRCLSNARPIVAAVEHETLAYLSASTATTLVEASSRLVHEVDWLGAPLPTEEQSRSA